MAPYPNPKMPSGPPLARGRGQCGCARPRARSGGAGRRATVLRVKVRPIEDAEFEEALDVFEAVAGEGLWLATEAPLRRGEVRARWKDLLASGEGTILVADDSAVVGVAAMVGRAEPE